MPTLSAGQLHASEMHLRGGAGVFCSQPHGAPCTPPPPLTTSLGGGRSILRLIAPFFPRKVAVGDLEWLIFWSGLVRLVVRLSWFFLIRFDHGCVMTPLSWVFLVFAHLRTIVRAWFVCCCGSCVVVLVLFSSMVGGSLLSLLFRVVVFLYT